MRQCVFHYKNYRIICRLQALTGNRWQPTAILENLAESEPPSHTYMHPKGFSEEDAECWAYTYAKNWIDENG